MNSTIKIKYLINDYIKRREITGIFLYKVTFFGPGLLDKNTVNFILNKLSEVECIDFCYLVFSKLDGVEKYTGFIGIKNIFSVRFGFVEYLNLHFSGFYNSDILYRFEKIDNLVVELKQLFADETFSEKNQVFCSYLKNDIEEADAFIENFRDANRLVNTDYKKFFTTRNTMYSSAINDVMGFNPEFCNESFMRILFNLKNYVLYKNVILKKIEKSQTCWYPIFEKKYVEDNLEVLMKELITYMPVQLHNCRLKNNKFSKKFNYEILPGLKENAVQVIEFEDGYLGIDNAKFFEKSYGDFSAYIGVMYINTRIKKLTTAEEVNIRKVVTQYKKFRKKMKYFGIFSQKLDSKNNINNSEIIENELFCFRYFWFFLKNIQNKYKGNDDVVHV